MHVFRHEVNARRYVQKAFCGGLTAIAGVSLITWHLSKNMPAELASKWDLVLPVVAGALLLAFVLFGLGPLMWKVPSGTFFRVTLTESQLRVESPHEHFGQSYDIRLDEISELRTVMSGTDELRHEIHATEGRTFEVKHNGGLRPDIVFERILALRPSLLHRRGQEKEFTTMA